MDDPLLYQYVNGNTTVSLYSNGTKIREFEGVPQTVHPDHLDIKITNWCNNPICGSFCHEKSNLSGLHGDLESLYEYLSPLPAGVELAIGGGHPLSHPQLEWFLIKAKEKGWVSNLTVNSYHLEQSRYVLEKFIENKLIYGIGISYYAVYHDIVIDFIKKHKNAVIHTILGIVSDSQIHRIVKDYDSAKILFLGYKTFGNGVDFIQKNPALQDKIKSWLWRMNNLIYFIKKTKLEATFSYDNLAIKQLNMKRFFSDENWKQFYCGDDGEFSMYYDAVNQKSKISSCHKDGLDSDNVIEAFLKLK